MKTQNRLKVLRDTLTVNQCIQQIEQKYHGEYNPNISDFDSFEQLLVYEALAESTPCNQAIYNGAETNGNVNGSINEPQLTQSKHDVNLLLTDSKQQVISNLSLCNYRTPPIEVARHLELFFSEWTSKESHWLYIAQKWNPRAILRTLNQLIKCQSNGSKSIKNPPAYFTYLIKFRKRRNNLTTEKQRHYVSSSITVDNVI